MIVNVIILIILLILSAYFSATEVAFISLTDAKVASMIKRKLPRANLIKKLKSQPRRLLVTILIGNNIVNIAAASLATIVAGDLFDSAVLGITTGVMTLLVLIFGEIIPKSYAANHNKKFAIFAAPALRMMQWSLYPLVAIFEWLTNLIAGQHQEERVSEEELRALAMAGAKQGTIEHDERAMIERLFSLNDLKAKDIMTARENIISIQHNISIDTANDIISNSHHSRFPIVDGTLDEVLGFVHAHDVLVAYHDESADRMVGDIVHPILKVPKGKRLDALLKHFRRKNLHMAIVQDSKKKTVGLITLEDVLEELVGEITDEHDRR